jgi:hypothetical protein
MCEFRVVLHYGGICDSVKINTNIVDELYVRQQENEPIRHFGV